MNYIKNDHPIAGFRKLLNESQRKLRGVSQKIFLVLTHEFDENILERKYDVMGTTGNVYTVSIKNVPICTCPDYTLRFKRCKHIYFVLKRIMKIQQEYEDIIEYNDNDLIHMFSNIPEITNNIKLHTNLVNKYVSLKTNGIILQKKIEDDDICPICLDTLYDCDEEIVFCKYYCGNNIHKECFDIINDNKTDITCLYCFKPWISNKSTLQPYINLNPI